MTNDGMTNDGMKTETTKTGRLEGDPTFHWKSDAGQDRWVVGCLEGKREGYFLDFGAYDGVTLSNTWVLEHELGWQGVCVEPNPKAFAELARCRACYKVQRAVWPENGRVMDLIDADGLSALKGWANVDERREAETFGMVEVETISPTELMNAFQVPRAIDYLSVDVEGPEYNVLLGVDFELRAIRLLTVEHAHDVSRQNGVRRWLGRWGYRWVEGNECNDDFFWQPALVPAGVNPQEEWEKLKGEMEKAETLQL
jgi:FkbM family methyltransferase